VLLFTLSSGNGGTTEEPPETPAIEPVPAADDASEQARNLAGWLREHAR
jgi:hypothetical protein